MRLASILIASSLVSLATGQTQEVYEIPAHPAFTFGWGDELVLGDDLDGDGIDDLLIARRTHGGGLFASVHSGATGIDLFLLSAPFSAHFFGESLGTIDDQSGDGVPEIVSIGSRSGSSQSGDGMILVHSGADGSLLQTIEAPDGMYFSEQLRSGLTVFEDVDQDGHRDFLVQTYTVPSQGQGKTMFSGQTGAPLFSILPMGIDEVLFPKVAKTSDHDGDGLGDILLASRISGIDHLVLRSSATGDLIDELPVLGPPHGLSNGEPFLSCADLDGDGLRDVALGAGAFAGLVRVYSTADGSLLREWNCALDPLPCMGNHLVELGDLSGDGHPDLFTLESNFLVPDGAGAYALDSKSGSILSEDHLAGVSGGYSGNSILLAMPDLDPLGASTFAVLASDPLRLSVRRALGQVGTPHCTSVPNSTGLAAETKALGSSSHAAAEFTLQMRNAPPGQFGLFVYGTQEAQVPYGAGLLCVGGSIVRLGAALITVEGTLTETLDLAGLGMPPGGTWTFQGVFRDSLVGGFLSSDAVTIQPLP